MNKLLTRFAVGASLVFVLCMVLTTGGCAKDQPCKAIVTVLGGNNNPDAGAVVHLVAPAPSTTDISTSTDASGKANFEVNLPQILDVEVWINNSPLPATGKVVRFEQGKTDEVTVNI